MYFIYHHMSDYFLLNIVISFYWTNLEVAHITLKMLGWKREEDSLYVSYFLLTWRCPCYKGIPQMKTYIVVTISSGAIFSLNSAIFEIHMIHDYFNKCRLILHIFEMNLPSSIMDSESNRLFFIIHKWSWARYFLLFLFRYRTFPILFIIYRYRVNLLWDWSLLILKVLQYIITSD